MAGEHTGNPRVFICIVPDRETDASGNSLACTYSRSVVLRLLGHSRRGRWSRGSDIEFRDSDINTKGDEGVHVGGLRSLGRGGSDDKVRLHSHAIDLRAILFHKFDNVLCARGLCACGFDVVVVIIQVGGGIGGCGCGEGDGDIGRTNGVIEDVRTVGAVFVER